MRIVPHALLVLILTASLGIANARAQSEEGQVHIPLEIYQQLVEAGQHPDLAPAGFALGQADVIVRVADTEGVTSAEISVDLTVEVLEDRWVLVPILPAGTPVSSVSVAGNPIQLINAPGGLAWGVKQQGRHAMQLRYQVDAVRSKAGYVLSLPLPEAAATKLSAELPGTGLDVALIPASGVTTRDAGDRTSVTATVPATRGRQLSWRAPSLQSHTISRALYSGKLVGDAIQWSGELSVELAGDETVTLELLPRNVTLSDIQVDGRKAAILVSEGSFATLVRGRGSHRLRIAFEVPVQRSDGPPQVALMIPEIPVSRFELTLPGRKEVTAAPATDVAHQVREKTTVASFHVPMTRQLRLSWTEAIPEDLRTETRANASLYHAVHAEEAVLY
ncbi:MAG: hypothetical protein ACR2P8_13815, partial [Myxococcota bacterium]